LISIGSMHESRREQFMRRTNSGFTLTELLVVFAVVGLVLAVVPVTFSHALDTMSLRKAMHDLTTGLRLTRAAATSTQSEAVFALAVDTRVVEVAGRKKTLTVPEGTEIVLVTARTEQISEQSGAIRFFPDGSSTGGRITVANDQFRSVIDINWLTGEVKVTP
jgi:general secretion pathway protein H